MPTVPVPYLLTILTGSVGGGFTWTPEEEHIPSGGNWNLRVGAHFTTPKLELEIAWAGSEGLTRELPYSYRASTTRFDTLIALADTERFDPYVALGLGWRSLNVGTETIDGLTGPVALNYVGMPATDAVLAAGLGARFALWGPLYLRLDTHLSLLAGGGPIDRPSPVYPGFDTSLSLHFRYEGPPDFDRDGVPDKVDQCKKVAEDHDFFDDKDGCPEDDDDRDGIGDLADRCKDTPEDYDGFEDEDGCPDQNNDRDDYPDTIDTCPNDAEIRNGWQDGDGCPDFIPEPLLGVIGIRREIKFDGEKLLPESDVFLTQVQTALVAHPAALFEVKVFWDGASGATEAHDRSRAEAVALYRWFEAHGLPNNRISYKVQGDLRPLASDSTPEGVATNRRVEIELVDPIGGDGKRVEFTSFKPEEWPP